MSRKRDMGSVFFAVIELTNDQIEARRKGFGYDPVDGEEQPDGEDNNGEEPPEPTLPF